MNSEVPILKRKFFPGYILGILIFNLLNISGIYSQALSGLYDSGSKSQKGSLSSALPVQMEQILTIPEGWSGISSFLIPLDTNVETIFQPVISDLIILQGQTGIYWPGQNINTIDNWNTEQGYKIKVNNDVSLTILSSTESNKTLQLEAGWNLIPVLSFCNIAIVDLFAGTDLCIIKEIAGLNIYWPEFGVYTLSVLEPGKAYFVLMESNAEITFPECYSSAPPPPPQHGQTSPSVSGISNLVPPGNLANEIIKTPATHIIAIPAGVFDALEIPEYSLIGAFDGEFNCFGVAPLQVENSSITLFGDDPVTACKDGFYEGEEIYFGACLPGSDIIIGFIADYNRNLPQNDGFFRDNGLSALLKIFPEKELVNPCGSWIHLFPNPVGDYLTIRSDEKDNAKFVILNIHGEIVHQGLLTNHLAKVDVTSLRAGIYIVKVEGDKNQFVRQFVKQ